MKAVENSVEVNLLEILQVCTDIWSSHNISRRRSPSPSYQNWICKLDFLLIRFLFLCDPCCLVFAEVYILYLCMSRGTQLHKINRHSLSQIVASTSDIAKKSCQNFTNTWNIYQDGLVEVSKGLAEIYQKQMLRQKQRIIHSTTVKWGRRTECIMHDTSHPNESPGESKQKTHC